MENRGTKIVTAIALVVAIIGLGIGFAAFSSTLTISSSATVTPSASTFKVVFSTSSTSESGNATIAGVKSLSTDKNFTASSASLTNTTISGISVNFTEPGQNVKYSFYAHNAGEYIAYLNTVVFAQAAPSCEATTPGGATAGLVSAMCEGITYSIKIGNLDAMTETDNDVDGHSIAKDSGELIEVVVSYGDNAARADGPVTVTLGSITLHYDSLDN